MPERYDYIAVGPHGVYALCEDMPSRASSCQRFIVETIKRGDRIEHVTVEEACRRHLLFLDRSDKSMGDAS